MKILEGYLTKQSYFQNETVILYIHSNLVSYNINVFNVFNKANILYNAENIKHIPNIIKSQNMFAEGCNITYFYKFDLANFDKSGIYIIKIFTDKINFYIPFILKNNNPNDMLILVNTNTWQAYNTYGGSSYYRFDDSGRFKINYKSVYINKNKPSKILSFARPHILVSNELRTYVEEEKLDKKEKFKSHLIYGELYLLRWLYDNNYNFNLIIDRDLDNNFNISIYKIFILNCHAEYWTNNMYENVVKNANNIISLAGNCVFKCIEYDKNKTMVNKYINNWRMPYLITGSYYTIDGYDTYAPYKINLQNASWICENITEEIIGTQCLNNSINPRKGSGCCGYETDKNMYKHKDQILVGKGTQKGGGDILYFQINNKHRFSVGSVIFSGSLFVDKNIEQMVKNVLTKFLLI